MRNVRPAVRAEVDDRALARLHARAFDAAYQPTAWGSRLLGHSLTWVSAHDGDDRLVGFADVAWGGGAHAFLPDTVVDPRRLAGVEP